MDKDLLKKIQKEIDEVLEERGVVFDKIDSLKKKLVAEMKEKERRALAEEVVKLVEKRLYDFIDERIKKIEGQNQQDKERIVEAIKSVKIEPKIIELPEIKIPDIKIPEIKAPKIDVSVPEIKIPPTKFPKEIEVKGFASFVKAAFEILKTKAKNAFEGIDKDNPLPVILTDEKGMFYKALSVIAGGGGGGFKIVGIENKNGVQVNPATEETLSKITKLSGAGANYSAVSVGTTAVQIPATPPASDYLLVVEADIANTGTIYYGFASGVTSATGISFDKLILKLTANDKIFVISDTANQSVRLTTKII